MADDAAMRSNLASGMHVFISRALQKILREAPKKHSALRKACVEVIGARAQRALRHTHVCTLRSRSRPRPRPGRAVSASPPLRAQTS